MHKLGITILLTLVIIVSAKEINSNKVVDYPDNYRSWRHVKTMIIQPGHQLEEPFGGIHHIYANTKAMSGLKNGTYENGAVFVFDLLNYDESNKTIIETDRKRLDVMQYERESFEETGGWGFDTFVGDSASERLDQNVFTACYDCHLGVKETNYVFSQYRQ